MTSAAILARTTRGGLLAAILAILFGLLLAAPLSAQTKIKFDPARDLEGFEKASFSEFQKLYPLQRFLDLAGKEIELPELAELRTEWTRERERVGKEIERIQADPQERFVFDLQRSLENKTFYSKLEYTIDRSVDGFVFLVQKPYSANPGRTAEVVRFFGPPLREIASTFQQRIATPLGLERRPDPRLWPVFVLASEADYVEFAKWDRPAAQIGGRAAFDSRAQMIVTWVGDVPPESGAAPVRRPALLALANALEHVHYKGTGERPSSLLVYSGVAGYLADFSPPSPDAPSKRALDEDTLGRIVGACGKKRERDVLLHPVEDLVEVRDAKDVLNLARNRAENLGVPMPEERLVLASFRDQAVSWVHFFLDGAGGRFRESFSRFLAAAMNAPVGLVDFRMELHDVELARLNRDFYAHLFKEHERVFPDKKLDWDVLKTLFADRAPPESASPAPAATSPTAIELLPPTFTMAELAIGPNELDVRHARALVQVRSGDLEGGLASLRALTAEVPLPPLDERVARDTHRTAELVRLRDAYLEHVRTSGGTLATHFQGRAVVAPVERVADGFVHFGQNPLGIGKIPLSSIPPFDIAKNAGDEKERGGTEAWTRFYPYVLVGERKWEKLLTDKSAPSESLRADARDWYPTTLRTGEVALLLDELAQTAQPRTPAAAVAAFGPVRAIVAGYGDLPVVQRRLQRLRQLATTIALATYDDKDPRDLVHGSFLSMGDGRVHIVYEFEETAEAQDFRKDEGFLSEFRAQLDPTKYDEAASKWEVQGGELTGSGAACYRHMLGFSAPMTVRYDLRFARPHGRSTHSPSFLVGICDDRAGSHVMLANFGDLIVNDPGTRYTQRCTNEVEKIKYGKVYALEVQNDGTNASTWLDGKKLCEVPCKGRTSGELFLWFHTDLRISVQRLEIQCKIDPAALEARRVAHVRTKLSEMGFAAPGAGK